MADTIHDPLPIGLTLACEHLAQTICQFNDVRENGFMGGHVNNLVDMVAAYRLTGGRSTAIRQLFERHTDDAAVAKAQRNGSPSPSLLARDRMVDALLAQYRLTGNKAFLEQACGAADRYIELRIQKPAEDFRDCSSSFWNELSPYWDVLYELYDKTGQRKYLAGGGRR